ncbi:MAG TPA: hypothetical protein VM510_01775, partial [Caulifigura sp.]|nr:hypothetical protein [Caulifigura sp.]
FYEVVENASASTPDRREFSVSLKAVPAGANLPDLSVSDSQSGRPLPFSVVHCSRQGPTLRPSACVFVVTGEQLPPSQRFEIVEPTAAPIRILKVAAVGKTAQNHLAIHDLDAQSFEVGLTMIPRNPLSNLQIEVEYERDGGASDRLILACHIVVAPKA